MGAMASQITCLTIVYSTIYSVTDQRKHQSSASLAFVWGIHRSPVNSSHKWPVTRKMLPSDDVIMVLPVLMLPVQEVIHQRGDGQSDPGLSHINVTISVMPSASHSMYSEWMWNILNRRMTYDRRNESQLHVFKLWPCPRYQVVSFNSLPEHLHVVWQSLSAYRMCNVGKIWY